MNITELKSVLRPWVIACTWPSSHQCDVKRYNQALKSAFELFGKPIGADYFIDAVTQLANEHHPDILPGGNDNFIAEYAKRTESIWSYLDDNLAR